MLLLYAMHLVLTVPGELKGAVRMEAVSDRRVQDRCKLSGIIVKTGVRSILAAGETVRHLSEEAPSFPVVLIGQFPNLRTVPLDQLSPFWHDGWIGMSPPFSLVRLFHKKEYRSAIGCLPHEGTGSGLEESDVHQSSREVTISASMPVVNATGDAAIMVISKASSGLGGSLQLQYLAIRNGTWSKVGSRIISVS